MRIPALAPLAATLVIALAGCSSSSSSSSSAPASPSPSPSSSSSASRGAGPAASWNPCSGLDPRRVGAALDARVTEETGTADTPRCAFLPVRKGGPTLNVTYTPFEGDFDAAWKSMGHLDGVVTEPDIAGATAARVVVNRSPKAVFVSGFVHSPGLIQTVNAVALRPYDAGRVAAATRSVLTTLVARAPDPGGRG